MIFGCRLLRKTSGLEAKKGRSLSDSDTNQQSRTCILRAVICLTLMLSGCTSVPDVLDFGTGPKVEADGRREVRQISWPAADSGEKPRYIYAGELYGEDNFRRDTGKSPNIGRQIIHALRWLVGLEDVGYVPRTLRRPQAGVVDTVGQRILVTDTSRQAVYVFDQAQGRLDIWENATLTNHFVSPTGIALGLSGEIYVADAELGYVTRLNQQGVSLGIVGQGMLTRPIGLAFDAASKQLYVADVHAHDIKVFGSEGQLLRTLGKRGVGSGEFNFPTYITLAQGELYVADTMNARVQVLDTSTGEARRVIGERGLNVGNLVRPKGVTVDTDGNVYIIESLHDYLLVYNRNGDLLLPIGGTGAAAGQFYLPSGVWSDVSNQIFVADMFNGRVSIFQLLGNTEPEIK